jgi:hypothetical protein
MGPLELQLHRELAIQMVRSCAHFLQDSPAGRRYDAEEQRAWFERTYQDWATTPRAELDGRTPAEAIREERWHLSQSGHLAAAPARRVELYTDLPQAEDVTDCIELESDEIASPVLPEPAALAAEADLGAEAGDDGIVATVPDDDGLPPAEEMARLSPAEEARWRAFRHHYLRDWTDDLTD